MTAMKIRFLGGIRQVTGSKFYLETPDSRVLVDCGLYQERPYLSSNWSRFSSSRRTSCPSS